MSTPSSDAPTRRGFLVVLAGAIGAGVAACGSSVRSRRAVAVATRRLTPPVSDLGSIAEIPVDDYVSRTVTAVPASELHGRPKEEGETLVYARRTVSAETGRADSVLVLSGICTDLGCPIRWVSPAQRFICPCHGGVFSATGLVEGGPPPVPLPSLPNVVFGGRVYTGKPPRDVRRTAQS